MKDLKLKFQEIKKLVKKNLLMKIKIYQLKIFQKLIIYLIKEVLYYFHLVKVKNSDHYNKTLHHKKTLKNLQNQIKLKFTNNFSMIN